jgi:hypothetical protein
MSDVVPKTLGGDFIQEGADNIDLNTETIDRQNTMHSMARAVLQVGQDHPPTSMRKDNVKSYNTQPPLFADNALNS